MSQFKALTEQLKILESLQELDLNIDKLKAEKNSIPQTLKALNDNVEKAKKAVELKKLETVEMDKTKKQTRAAIELNQDRLSRSQGRVEGVKNTQEYNAITKEVEQLTKMNATLEEQIKKIDADLAAIETALAPLNANLEKAKGELDGKTQELGGQGDALDKKLAELGTERNGFTVHIEKRILSLYDRVRAGRAGLGVSPAIGGRCKACNMVVPPQMFNELQKGKELHNCPSCHRILYIK